MSLQILLYPAIILNMQKGFPEHYNGPVMRGSNAQHIAESFGQVIIQEISNLQYTLRYNIFQLYQQVKLQFKRNESGLQTTAILHDQCRETIARAGRFRISEGYFSLLYSKAWQGTIQCEANSRLTSFDTTWTDQLLQQFLPEESEWWQLFRPVHPEIPSIIGHPYRKITPALSDLIRQLIYSSYDESLSEHSIDHLLKEYLTEILREIANPAWLKEIITKPNLEKIESARQLIASNPFHHIRSSELARKVNMNECKLKALFMKATGMGTFDYMMYLRCCVVRDRILNTDLPLKAFVKESGYSDLANFVNGFKRHLGCTPADIRK